MLSAMHWSRHANCDSAADSISFICCLTCCWRHMVGHCWYCAGIASGYLLSFLCTSPTENDEPGKDECLAEAQSWYGRDSANFCIILFPDLQAESTADLSFANSPECACGLGCYDNTATASALGSSNCQRTVLTASACLPTHWRHLSKGHMHCCCCRAEVPVSLPYWAEQAIKLTDAVDDRKTACRHAVHRPAASQSDL